MDFCSLPGIFVLFRLFFVASFFLLCVVFLGGKDFIPLFREILHLLLVLFAFFGFLTFERVFLSFPTAYICLLPLFVWIVTQYLVCCLVDHYRRPGDFGFSVSKRVETSGDVEGES